MYWNLTESKQEINTSTGVLFAAVSDSEAHGVGLNVKKVKTPHKHIERRTAATCLKEEIYNFSSIKKVP